MPGTRRVIINCDRRKKLDFMAIPSYDKFYRAILETLEDGAVHDSKETILHCAEKFNLTDEEKTALLESGRQSILANRVGWARTYLKKSGLIKSVSRGKYQITEEGRRAVSDPDLIIDNSYLAGFQGFREFVKDAEVTNTSSELSENDSVKKTPQEIMETAYNGINEQLADELMTNIMDQSPAFFERLVIDLLEKMGYGGDLDNPGIVTGRPGDEGIDGIIRQDTLGFDKIYVQAKRWSEDHSVGEPDIQQFAGALMG